MKSKYAKLTVSILLMLINSEVASRGAEVFVDSFDYGNGPLVGALNSLWESHSQAGNGPVLVTSGRMELRSDQLEDINAPLDGGPYTAEGEVQVLFGQFMLEVAELPTSAGTYIAHFRSGNAHRARVWISTADAAEGHYRIGIGNSSGADADSGQVSVDLQTNVNYRVVFRYHLSSGVSSIGIDPAKESDLMTTAADPVGLSSVNSIAFRQSREIGSLWIDDVLVTDEFPNSSAPGVRLEIFMQDGSLVVRWPSHVADYSLESATSVDSANWVSDELPIQTDEQWNAYRISDNAGSQFFRLRQR